MCVVVFSVQSADGLRIVDAQYRNAGMYECEARTTIHSLTAAAPVTIVGK